jgi:VanZ family protein
MLLALVGGLAASLEMLGAGYALTHAGYNTQHAALGLVVSGMFIAIAYSMFKEAVQLQKGRTR